jgi:hypothetical protein
LAKPRRIDKPLAKQGVRLSKRYIVYHAPEDLIRAHTLVSAIGAGECIIAELNPEVAKVRMFGSLTRVALWSKSSERMSAVLDSLLDRNSPTLFCLVDDTPLAAPFSGVPTLPVGSMDGGVNATQVRDALARVGGSGAPVPAGGPSKEVGGTFEAPARKASRTPLLIVGGLAVCAAGAAGAAFLLGLL